LYVLTVAANAIESWVRDRLDVLVGLVLTALARPALTGLDARNLVERRRAEAARSSTGSADIIERIDRAPRGYLLTQDSATVARHAMLLEPLPARGRARVTVDALPSGDWRVEVASRDRTGLLATVAGVLADCGLDVVDATVATWDDGGALESFVVRPVVPAEGHIAVGAPRAEVLRDAIVGAFDRRPESEPDPDAVVTFDDLASPWYTICEVTTRDRRGVLRAIAVGLASGGADVHSARLSSADGQVRDVFELTDRNGRKLDEATKAAVQAAITGGVTPRRRVVRPTR
jgi:[protein-PII] uridylyltransferase